jgi:hypothetical protein
VPGALSIEWASGVQLRIDNRLRIPENSVKREQRHTRVPMRRSGFAGAHSNFEKPNMGIFVKEAVVARRGQHGIVGYRKRPLL